jgi:uncharacterized phage-associated protein
LLVLPTCITILGNDPDNERKATQAAAYLLQKRGGQMSYMKLIKLLYYADRTALARFGRPITTDRYVSMDRGPVLSHVLDLATDGDVPGEELIWSAAISEPIENYEVRLNVDPGDDELSEAEIEVLEEIFKRFGHLSRWELVELTHKLPEWKDPEGSRIAISYRDILEAQEVSEDEIAAIEEEICGIATTQALVGAR